MVPDEGAVEEFVAAALNSAFHDRVYSRNADTAEDNLDVRVGVDGVEQGGGFPSRSWIRNCAELVPLEKSSLLVRRQVCTR